jgi:hypothetical protein
LQVDGSCSFNHQGDGDASWKKKERIGFQIILFAMPIYILILFIFIYHGLYVWIFYMAGECLYNLKLKAAFV